MSKKHKNVWRFSNNIDLLLTAISAITGCASISPFASLVVIPIGTISFATGLEICGITTGIKKISQ